MAKVLIKSETLTPFGGIFILKYFYRTHVILSVFYPKKGKTQTLTQTQNSLTPKAFNSLNSKTPNLLNLMHDLVKKSICHFVKKSFSSVSRYHF